MKGWLGGAPFHGNIQARSFTMKRGKVVEDGATVHGNTNKNSFTFNIVVGLTPQLINGRDTPTLSDLTDLFSKNLLSPYGC